MKVISIVNLKGGVGKTATAINMASILATEHSKRVLLIDADPQANATRFFGGENAPAKLYDVFTHPDTWGSYCWMTQVDGVDIIPASMDLLQLDVAAATADAKLIPQIKQYYDDGRMPESVAYEIAKCSADDQQLIAKVKGNGQDGLGAMRCGEAERILSDRDSLAARKCKYACGVPCGNVVKSLQKTTGNYMRSCEHTCCMECYDIATCDKYCKVAKDRHLQLREDKAEAEQRANDEAAKRRGERESKCRIYWGRLTHALAAYGEQEAVAEALHTTVAGLASGGTYWAPYRSVAVESLDALVAAADILGVTTDYLLCRTDNPHFTTLPQRESKKEDDA